MSNYDFAGMPSINIPRSMWKGGNNITTSIRHGLFTPIECFPVLPGDSINYKFKSLVRMQTPIAPIMGNIDATYVAFFVPHRLTWEHFEEFMGANKTSAGYQQNTYTFPCAGFYTVAPGSLSHYLGKPLATSTGNITYWANILKERGYYEIWNNFVRAQQITNPVIVNYADSLKNYGVASMIGSWNGNYMNPGDAYTSLLPVAKKFDYFTACTISPQFGAAVELPLGSVAPIITQDTTHDMGKALQLSDGNTYTNNTALAHATNNKIQIASSGTLTTGTDYVQYSNMVADLTTATAAKVNDVRYAFQLQKFLERSNFAGTTMWGQLQVHYGVTSPDSRLQRPEFLGQFTHPIVIHQVVATADTVNSGVPTSVGNTGAVSVTASGEISLFDKAFVEPGYVYILVFFKHRRAYTQGIMREDRKLDRMEMYTPEMANLGDQATLVTELWHSATEGKVFGYQEHWAEYRYRPDRVSGMLDPAANGQLAFWTLAEKFTQEPQLNDDFIFEDRTELDRALTTGSTYDEYILDFWQDITWKREMPVKTIPGLIDHFGAI